jgi:Flp pilus assembly protein CpaB
VNAVAITAPDTRTNGQRPASNGSASPRPKGHRRSIAERLTLNVVVGVVAALLAFVLAATLLADRREMVTVAVATDAIPAGAVITADSVEQSEVPAQTGFADSLISYDTAVSGELVASRTLQAGEPLTVSAVGTATGTSGQRVMSIPLEIWQAANGDIEVGDQVDVIEASRDGVARYVLTGASVVGRSGSESSGGLVSSARAGDHVISVEVDANEALLLAAAIESGNITVVRSTGAPPVEATAVGANVTGDGG